MAPSADIAAATYSSKANTDGRQEVEALRAMAEDLGFRIIPMTEGELASAPSAHPEKISDMIKRLAWLKSAAEASKNAAKAYEEEEGALRETLSEQMALESVHSSQAGGWTAYFTTTYKMRKRSDDVTTEDILQALKDAGQTGMISEKYNYQTVQAWLKELVKDELPIPGPLAELVQLDEAKKVRLRRSGRS
jgi:hypothetical protein